MSTSTDLVSPLIINGERVPGRHAMEVINPATGQAFATVGAADERQLEDAVQAASRAFRAWASQPLAERRACLLALGERIEAGSEELATLLTREQGKPLREARMEVAGCLRTLRGFADMTLPPTPLQGFPGVNVVEYRDPLGVVAAITPWNFPVALLMSKLAPALLMGNTVVAKPAPTTPLTSLWIGEQCRQVMPAGVVNVVVDRNDLGAALCAHPLVAKVSFTGSTATGKRVMATASASIKRVTLELGGNDAALVLDDIDPVLVARKLFDGAMVNAGQVCVAIKRAYVPTSSYAAVCDELARLAQAAVVGDGMDDATRIGPVQNRAQYDKLKQLLAETRDVGRVLAGGQALPQDGYFIAPTIVADVPESARIVCEEQFGPILPVLAYSDLDDAVRRINNSEFGLAATVWTTDAARGAALARQIESGTVWVNHHLGLHYGVPFRGAKQSGLGTEMGLDGLKEFTQGRVVSIAAA